MELKGPASNAKTSVVLSKKNKCISKSGSFTLILLILTSIVASVYWQTPIHSAIFISLIVACGFGLAYQFSWSELREMIFCGISESLFLLALMPLIGVVIGQWIIGGVVPSMVYYGVKLLTPQTFFIFAPIFTALVAMSIGTSWGTASTIGLAMMSIGAAMGVNKEVLAATIVGALFCGEILSPLAGSTNLTISLMRVKYTEHIKTIRVPVLITFGLSLLYSFWWFKGESFSSSPHLITEVLTAIQQNYNVSPALLLIPAIVIFLSWRGVKIIPVLTIGTVLSMVSAVLFQNVAIKTVLETIYNGPPSLNSHYIINGLVQNGGIMRMMSISSLLFLSLGLAGLLENMGVLDAVMSSLLPSLKKRPIKLLFFTLIIGIFLSMVAGSQSLAIMLLIKLISPIFHSGIGGKWGSATVMASAAVIPPLIPWNINGLFLTNLLGVATVAYFRHSVFCLALPFSVICWYLITCRVDRPAVIAK